MNRQTDSDAVVGGSMASGRGVDRHVRRRRSLQGAALAGALVLLVSGCGLSIGTAGDRVTEEREIDDATAVVLSAAGDLRVRLGDEPSLTVTGGRNLLERLRTEVDDGTLEIDLRRRGIVLGDTELEFDLTLTSLDELTIEGAGDAEADFGDAEDVLFEIRGAGDIETRRLDAERVRVAISGSGDIEMSGATDEAIIQINGAGDVDAEDLRSQRAQVVITGSGEVDLAVRDELDVTVSGSGTVTYSGDPEVRSEISGAGEVRQR